MDSEIPSQPTIRGSLRDAGMRLVGLLIAVALAIAVAAVSWPQLATARQTGSNVMAGELVSERRFGQTFRAPFSSLYRVDVLLATYGRRNEGPVLFHLTSGDRQGTELATVEIEAAQVRNNAHRRFVFEPIADSCGRVFYFYIEAPTAAAGNAITAWQTDFDSFPGGQAHIDDQPTEGDLRFVAYYRSNPHEAWQALSERLRSWHPMLWEARWLVLGLVVAWVVGVGVLLGELLVLGSRNE